MSDIMPVQTTTLFPELAAADPEAFRVLAVEALAETSVFGVELWNLTTESGLVDFNRLTIDSSTWNSRSVGGAITLGTSPMDARSRERLLFHDERFDYTDEVTYRLLHEVNHSVLYLAQRDSAEPLLRASTDIRSIDDGSKGLTPLGSLDHYVGQKKTIEDSTELMTMYAWDPEYLREYTEFLADPRQLELRQHLGLISMTEGKVLYGIVAQAVEGAL